MNRKLMFFFITFFCFLLWLYYAIYESSVNNWWTVNEIKKQTEDTVAIGVSMVKVLVGTFIFTFSGFIFYLLIRKRQ